jgi:rhamnosyltransferase
MEVSIIIPTYHGGDDLLKTLSAIFNQKTTKSFEVILIDSGSNPDHIVEIKKFPLKMISIDKADFNHGLTRDLGANYAEGKFLIFLNQDAIPANEDWMEEMIAPFYSESPPKACQGLMEERKDVPLFFWHSCGERFYFTSESKNWIKKYYNMGFSTVNCAIPKEIWQKYNFGKTDIMEDKKFQSQVHQSPNDIIYTKGLVYHSHDYNWRSLSKRCQDEGYGWQLLGEEYTFGQMWKDLFIWKNYLELFNGVKKSQIKNSAALFFPWLRPIWLFKGNHFNKKLR